MISLKYTEQENTVLVSNDRNNLNRLKQKKILDCFSLVFVKDKKWFVITKRKTVLLYL